MENLEILIDDLKEENLFVEKGQAKAVLPQERHLKFYQWGVGDKGKFTGARDFDTARKERIQLPMQNGQLISRVTIGGNPMTFDDRKLRLDRISESNGNYTVHVAPTHFYEFEATNVAAANDRALRTYLMEKGLVDFNDKRAYFSSTMAVNGVPVTAEGHVVVFQRLDEPNMLSPGYWHVIGGMFDPFKKVGQEQDPYEELFSEKNPSEALREMLKKRIKKEFREEENLQAKFELAGLTYGINPDFTYIAKVNLSDKEFIDKIKTARRKESKDYRIFETPEKLAEFLDSANAMDSQLKLVPQGYGALLLYLKQAAPKYYSQLSRQITL